MEIIDVAKHTVDEKSRTISSRTSSSNSIRTKVSYGIACCRKRENTGEWEMLAICKRYTYAYSMFVFGRYMNQDSRIISLFNSMTLDEKMDIMSFDFARMWSRIWADTKRVQVYYRSKNKFETFFCATEAKQNRLLRIIQSSKQNSQRIWEIPKGRKKDDEESDIHCAVREFGEETGVNKSHYSIHDAKRTYSFVDVNPANDQRTKFVYIYYAASAHNGINPHVNFSVRDQINEVSEIRWLSVNEMRLVDTKGHLEAVAKPLFAFVKKNVV
jgi:8-oxo-dGTP pyrophosphatase MutT (NUDIX family)